MIRLTREVRFSLIADSAEHSVTNSWGGWPSPTQIAPSMSLQCTLAGEIEPVSGYLCNIKLIDDVLRQRVIKPACENYGEMSLEQLLQFAWQQSKDQFPEHCHLQKMQLSVTPTLQYTCHEKDDTMVELTQQFEFSASHRLHNPELTDEENRRLFGKCNNPHGHGHNYVVMISIEGKPGDDGRLVELEHFNSIVKETVIDKMDHRNLNVELPEFKTLNPSVENIAIVIWDSLREKIEGMAEDGLELRRIRVYETPKTWADYEGQ